MKKNRIILIIHSILCGCINGLFSTGAGLVLVPVLIYILKYNQLVARGTAICVIYVLCLINLVIYSHQFEFRIEYLYVILGALLGNYVGNIWVDKVNKKWLGISFAFFTIFMGIGMIK